MALYHWATSETETPQPETSGAVSDVTALSALQVTTTRTNFMKD